MSDSFRFMSFLIIERLAAEGLFGHSTSEASSAPATSTSTGECADVRLMCVVVVSVMQNHEYPQTQFQGHGK